VLAQWDGRRRYANLRKLARLARSYEELRGPDVQGFVRFVAEQDAVGASELEAVAEEEGTDVIRLLTIHSAKGLEFKVVVVADAGRDRARPDADEILCLPDGRLGFRPADPDTGKRLTTAEYEAVRAAEQAAEQAERRRLYYVAMTRAIDRLIVSGAVGERGPDERTPIGWVLDRLELNDLGAAEAVAEIERGEARVLVRLDRHAPEPEAVLTEPAVLEQLELFEVAENGAAAVEAPELAPLAEVPAPPLHRVRRLSYSALSLFERCSYRYYAERVVGLRPADAAGTVPGHTGLAATEIGDAVHALLEDVDLRAPEVPANLPELVRARYPAATDEEVERIRGFVASYCSSDLAARIASLHGATAELPFAFEHDGVLLHGRIDVLTRDPGGRTAIVLDYKTNSLAEGEPDEIVAKDYRLQRLVYALACFRAGADEVEVVYHFLERPDAVVTDCYELEDVPALEAELSTAIVTIQANDFRPTPDEFVCADCPALDLVCAGPRLRTA
jgi:ATP-dependent helicase/nuclease subunit A